MSNKVLHFKDLLFGALNLQVVFTGYDDKGSALAVELVNAVSGRQDETAVNNGAATPLQERARSVLQLDSNLFVFFSQERALFINPSRGSMSYD